MYKRGIGFLIVTLLFITGCTKVTKNLDQVISATLISGNIITNTASTGYELYIPVGVKQVVDSQYNQRFKIRDCNVYLYVDTISHYYKNSLNYKSDSSYDYYYKELELDGKTGYIGINKVEDDLYFVEVVYNYSKGEFYANLEDLPIVLANDLIIQRSIKYNDKLIALELGNDISDGRELRYQLDSPKDSKSTFSDYLQEYVPEDVSEEVELPDDN